MPLTPTEASTEPGPAPSWPWVLPMGLFVATGLLETPLASHHVLVYSVRIATVAIAAWLLRRAYPRPRLHGCLLAGLLGLPAAAIWITLAKLDLEAPVREWLPAGWVSSARGAFDADSLDGLEHGVFLAVRLLGLIVVVPLAEELFWRGWLARWLVRPEFDRVQIGTFTRLSFLGVVIGFVLLHPEWIAAATWCAAANWILLRSKNLWAAIAFHASTNAALGGWILATRDWSLW